MVCPLTLRPPRDRMASMRPFTQLVLVAVASILPLMQQPLAVIDHFILGINELDRGVAEFERMTGVKPVTGGVHPGRGTRNALASLGNGRYIEVIAPDPKQTVSTPMVQELRALESLRPIGWALGTQDLFALQARVQQREIEHSAIQPGSRALPDGSRLAWSTFGVMRPAHNWIPFFIRWTDPAKQPSHTSPAGCALDSVQLEDPNPDAVLTVLRAVELKVP